MHRVLGVRPWTVAAVLFSGGVTLLAPAIAADLAAIALIGLASCAFALCQRTSTLPPGSGTTAGDPLHALVFGYSGPHAVDLTGNW